MNQEAKFDKLNKVRKKTEIKLVIFYVMVITVGIIFLSITLIPQLIIFVIALCVILIGIGHKPIIKNYRIQFKNTIVPMELKSFSDNVTYNVMGLDKNEAELTGMFEKFTKFKSEDTITGEFSDVNFKCSDVKLGYYTGGKHRRYVPVCHGQLYIFDFNKEFKAKTIIREKKALFLMGLKRIKLESEKFNQHFSTFTNNQHDCFYILTPHFMEKLLELEANHPGTLFIAFYNNQLHIGIHNNKDRFEPPLFTDINKTIITRQTDDLLLIKNIIEDLKLNEKIFI